MHILNLQQDSTSGPACTSNVSMKPLPGQLPVILLSASSCLPEIKPDPPRALSFCILKLSWNLSSRSPHALCDTPTADPSEILNSPDHIFAYTAHAVQQGKDHCLFSSLPHCSISPALGKLQVLNKHSLNQIQTKIFEKKIWIHGISDLPTR